MSTCLAYDTGGKDTDGKPVYEEIGVNHAYAWEAGKSVEQMVRVVWDKEAKVWARWDEINKTYYKENGKRKIWNPSNTTDPWSTEI